MTTQQLAVNYANSIADQLWALDSSGEIFPHDCERDETERKEISCEESPGCMDNLGAYGYLDNVLDIEYRVSSDRDYRSAKILIAYGGPNAWIDTDTQTLSVHWDEYVTRALPSSFCSELDEALGSLFEVVSL